jgi:stage V sporulation protein SpoVS
LYQSKAQAIAPSAAQAIKAVAILRQHEIRPYYQDDLGSIIEMLRTLN